MTSFEDPFYPEIVDRLPAGAKPSEYITSLEVQARKLDGSCCGENCYATG